VRSLGMPLAFGAVDGGIVEVVIPLEVAVPHAA